MSDSEPNENCNKSGRDALNQIQNAEGLGRGKSGSKAPTGLLAEFLSAVMTKDYQTAFKYCAKILSYEPDNTTARDFYPLILEKLELISNEEYEDSSSDTYSTDSKSSGSSSFSQTCSQSSDEDKRLSSGDENYSKLGRKNAVKDLIADLKANEDRAGSKSVKSQRSRICCCTGAESSSKSLPVKTHSKERLQSKSTETSTMSSKLLIHPTKTKILKTSSFSNEEQKKQQKSKKVKQKEQETSTLPENPTCSKILLYPTRTITFPKVTPSQTKCDKG